MAVCAAGFRPIRADYYDDTDRGDITARLRKHAERVDREEDQYDSVFNGGKSYSSSYNGGPGGLVEI